jgi:hypothetical protein
MSLDIGLPSNIRLINPHTEGKQHGGGSAVAEEATVPALYLPPDVETVRHRKTQQQQVIENISFLLLTPNVALDNIVVSASGYRLEKKGLFRFLLGGRLRRGRTQSAVIIVFSFVNQE